jgi:NtrC-family two-component system response regulator AlgB
MKDDTMGKRSALIVDDDTNLSTTLIFLLEERGYTALTAKQGKLGLEAYDSSLPDVVFLDLKLPDMSGLEVLEELGERSHRSSIVMITGHASVDTAVSAIRKGAFDYLVKPFSAAQVEHVLDMIERFRRLETEVKSLRSELNGIVHQGAFLTRNAQVKKVLQIARQVAETKASILVTGESGTGKGLLARLVHDWSPRSDQPFVTVDCTALQESLLESDLFGHVKGAFTGAVRDKPGKVESADGGTLFLDEVGELSPSLQAKLLRFLQSREFERVGDTKVRTVDARVIAATNRNLEEMVHECLFRQDLYFRLNVVELSIPPLRQRLDDIPVLADHFLDHFRNMHGRDVRGFAPSVISQLTRYPWPGNVRELANVIERAVAMASGPQLTPEDFPEGVRRPKPIAGTPPTLEELEREHISSVLVQTATMDEAARILGIDPATLWRKRRKYGLG